MMRNMKEEVLLFLVPILRRFGVVLDLVISTYFLSKSLISNDVKCLSTLFCIIFMKQNSARFANDTPVLGTRPLGL